MAIIFDLWVECANGPARDAVAAHFDGFEKQLATGKTISFRCDPEGAGTVLVWSQQLGARGVRTLNDALEMTEAGLWLYAHLRTAPEFAFARVAHEASCIPLSDLPGWLTEHGAGVRLSIECVMSSEVFDSLGKPAFCRAFRPGYLWTGYSGETYSPLYSNDQPALESIRTDLFPE